MPPMPTETISQVGPLLSRSFEHILIQILSPGISWARMTQRLSSANFPPKGRKKSVARLGAGSTFRYTLAGGDARVLSDFSSFSGTLTTQVALTNPISVTFFSLFSKPYLGILKKRSRRGKDKGDGS